MTSVTQAGCSTDGRRSSELRCRTIGTSLLTAVERSVRSFSDFGHSAERLLKHQDVHPYLEKSYKRTQTSRPYRYCDVRQEVKHRQATIISEVTSLMNIHTSSDVRLFCKKQLFKLLQPRVAAPPVLPLLLALHDGERHLLAPSQARLCIFLTL